MREWAPCMIRVFISSEVFSSLRIDSSATERNRQNIYNLFCVVHKHFVYVYLHVIMKQIGDVTHLLFRSSWCIRCTWARVVVVYESWETRVDSRHVLVLSRTRCKCRSTNAFNTRTGRYGNQLWRMLLNVWKRTHPLRTPRIRLSIKNEPRMMSGTK